MNWSETNSLLKGVINTLDTLSDPLRIASFDLDDTLIHRPSGRSKTEDKKWKLIDATIIDKISDLVKDNFCIVIFTNQGGMSVNKNFDKPMWRIAVNDLVKILTSKIKSGKFYFAVYVAKKYDMYRKPNIGMWNSMKDDLKAEFELDKLRISNRSFFCGDAAGRISSSIFKQKIYPSVSKSAGDFSDTDRKFALNVGIKFMTPEEFFLADSPEYEYKMLGINPTKYLKAIDNGDDKIIINVTSTKTETIDICSDHVKFKPRSKELIIMIAPPGSGKTDFVKKYILPHGYVHINQDICKTKAKCLALATDAMDKKKSVVIDNTNPDIMTRMAYTTIAIDKGYKNIRAIVMVTPISIANHLNNTRHIYSNGTINKVNKIAYGTFTKNYVKPLDTENFDLIEKINFVFDTDQLSDPKWKKSFLKWSEA